MGLKNTAQSLSFVWLLFSYTAHSANKIKKLKIQLCSTKQDNNTNPTERTVCLRSQPCVCAPTGSEFISTTTAEFKYTDKLTHVLRGIAS